jgi:hypothetical protein
MTDGDIEKLVERAVGPSFKTLDQFTEALLTEDDERKADTLRGEAATILHHFLATIEALARDKERLEGALTAARGWLSGWASAEPQIAIIDAALSPTNRDDGEVQDGK